MTFLTKEKLFSVKWFRTYLLITAGSFILAAGLVFFITPHKIVPGGVYGIRYDKALFIVSDQYQIVRDKLIRDLCRGGTLISAKGMWEGKERKIIFTNVKRREMSILQDFIREVDQGAFMTVINASEVIGLGFKSLEEKQLFLNIGNIGSQPAFPADIGFSQLDPDHKFMGSACIIADLTHRGIISISEIQGINGNTGHGHKGMIGTIGNPEPIVLQVE